MMKIMRKLFFKFDYKGIHYQKKNKNIQS